MPRVQGLLSSVRDALNRTYSKKDSAKSFDGGSSSRRKLNKIDSAHSGDYLASDAAESIDRGWMDIMLRRTAQGAQTPQGVLQHPSTRFTDFGFAMTAVVKIECWLRSNLRWRRATAKGRVPHQSIQGALS